VSPAAEFGNAPSALRLIGRTPLRRRLARRRSWGRQRSPRRRCSTPAPLAEFSDSARQAACRVPLVQAFHLADWAGPALAPRACSFSPHQAAAALPRRRGRPMHSSSAVPAAERWAQDWQAPCPASTRRWAALATVWRARPDIAECRCAGGSSRGRRRCGVVDDRVDEVGSWMLLKMMLFSRHIDWRTHKGRHRHEHRTRQDEQSRHQDRWAPAPRNPAVAAARNAGRT
jgi:hypothetical protein